MLDRILRLLHLRRESYVAHVVECAIVQGFQRGYAAGYELGCAVGEINGLDRALGTVAEKLELGATPEQAMAAADRRLH